MSSVCRFPNAYMYTPHINNNVNLIHLFSPESEQLRFWAAVRHRVFVLAESRE